MSEQTSQGGSVRRRDIISRVLAAVFGGYGFTWAAMAALAKVLPLARFDAVMLVSMLSFFLYALVAIWVFAARTLVQVWLGVSLALPLALFAFWAELGGLH